MISENKLLFNLDNLNEGKPITADLFLTNFCNNRCVYCTYSRWELDNNRKYVTIEEFKRNIKILDRLGVKGYILTGGGEPMLNPDFDKIVEFLETNKYNYGINTNFNVLKRCNPKYLKVSLDVSNKEDYKKIRGIDGFDKVMQNIKEYAKIKKNTVLGVQCVVTKDTNVIEFYDLIKDFDVDYIVYRPLESTNAIDFESQNLSAIKTIKQICKADNRVILSYKWNELRTKFPKCYANKYQIAVDENSNIIYCCHKPYEVVCHITDADILKKREQYKTNISKCDVPCRLTGANKFIQKLEIRPNDFMFI